MSEPANKDGNIKHVFLLKKFVYSAIQLKLKLIFLFPQAVEELFNLMQLFVAQRPDMREEELEDVKQFKKTTISCYLRCLDGRSCWTTLIRYTHTHSLKSA